jgi:hypothetical protein
VTATLFTADCKFAPYWWDAVPRPALAEVALPKHADVVTWCSQMRIDAMLVRQRAAIPPAAQNAYFTLP